MQYGNFEYRVVYNKAEGYCVMKLYEKSGIYYFISKLASTPYGNSIDNLKSDMKKFLIAFEKPTLLFENIKEITSFSRP